MTLLKLLSAISMVIMIASCDATIHQYPDIRKELVILQLNVSRKPPRSYKQVVYDTDWKPTIIELEGSADTYQWPSDFALRITVEVYRDINDVTRANGMEDEKPIERRVVWVDACMDEPQDTVHLYLPDGHYRAISFADYVPLSNLNDWHYNTQKLTNITTDLTTYPRNPHLRSSAAGQVSFVMTHQLTEGGYPATADAPDVPELSRIIPIRLTRPSGRFRLIATDSRLSPMPMRNTSIKLVYKDFVTTGYNVLTGEPNNYISSYGFITQPPLGEVNASTDQTLLVEDYLFTGYNRENIFHAVMIITDVYGHPINTTPNIEFPLVRDGETVIYAPFFSVSRDSPSGGAGFDIDENFEGEFIVTI